MSADEDRLDVIHNQIFIDDKIITQDFQSWEVTLFVVVNEANSFANLF